MRTVTAPAGRAALLPKRLLSLAGDDRLVEQIRRGNDGAFAVAFERHSGPVLSFCRHMLGSREEAEDAVQHTFAAAHRNLLADEREIRLKPWLYAIARNRCVSMLRARREQASEELDVRTDGLHEQVQRRAELRDLLGDLQDLPAEQRAALLLAELGDLPHTDIAAVLGCEVARVKALVFRARSGLLDRREARELPCAEVREKLANLRGGSLRRSELKHHIRVCAGCREFRDEVRRQRQLMAAVLPVVPTAGLKAGVLGAIGIGGGSAGGGGLVAAGGSSAIAKLAVAGVLVGGSAVVGTTALERGHGTPKPETPAAAAPAAAAERRDVSRPAVAPVAATGETSRRAHRKRSSRRRHRAGSHRGKPSSLRRHAAKVKPVRERQANHAPGRGRKITKKPKKLKRTPPRSHPRPRPPKANAPPAVAPPARQEQDSGDTKSGSGSEGRDKPNQHGD